jgi:putative heme iron utilization protein
LYFPAVPLRRFCIFQIADVKMQTFFSRNVSITIMYINKNLGMYVYGVYLGRAINRQHEKQQEQAFALRLNKASVRACKQACLQQACASYVV